MPSHLLGGVVSLAFALAGLPGAVVSAADVELAPLPSASAYAEGAARDAVRFACAARLEPLRAFFGEAGLPFRMALVRPQDAGYCHVFYEPTLRGFRASPDDHAVAELMLGAESLAFLETGSHERGDAVGAASAILRQAEQPLAVSISVPQELPRRLYEKASVAHFGEALHAVTLLDAAPGSSPGWAQDYLKAGVSSRGVTLLAPHALFQGDPEKGTRYPAMIERLALQDPRVVRSRLAWEGGDLQFTLDPGDPAKLILYYGGAAKPYWGEALTPAEYEYVLMLEFGADRAVDLSGLAPHVDYVVAFLPRQGTALFAVPETGNRRLAADIATALIERYPGRRCPEALLELAALLDGERPLDPTRLRQAVQRVRAEAGLPGPSLDRDLAGRMSAFVDAHCPDRTSCFSRSNQKRMLQRDPELFGRWVSLARRAQGEGAYLEAQLALIEGQFEAVPRAIAERVRRKIAELEGLGFRVVRVPALRVNMDRERGWPGVSYVNLLAAGEQLFVPRFGLGEAEGQLLARLASDLPGLSVVPVYSRDLLTMNGGLHCLFGIVRTPSHPEAARAASWGARP